MALLYAESVEHMDLDEMQKTHEDEIKILNDIDRIAVQYSMKNSDENKKLLEEKIEEYLRHVKTHFSNEESLMKKYNFPNYDMHKMSHDMFLADLNITLKQWRKFGDVNKVVNFIRKSPEWIVLHINTVDAPTSAYLAQKMAQESDK